MPVCASCMKERRRLKMSYAGLFHLKESQEPREPAVWVSFAGGPIRVLLWKAGG